MNNNRQICTCSTECLKCSHTQSLDIYFSVMANDRHPWLHATHAGNVAEEC
jgi:hypothetical protein